MPVNSRNDAAYQREFTPLQEIETKAKSIAVKEKTSVHHYLALREFSCGNTGKRIKLGWECYCVCLSAASVIELSVVDQSTVHICLELEKHPVVCVSKSHDFM